MHSNYLTIEHVTPGMEKLLSEQLNFKTSRFIWKIKFNTALDAKSVNNQNLSVLDSNGKPLKTNISYDSNTNCINIEPLEPYNASESYLLNISTKVRSKGGKPLKRQVSVKFKM